MNLSKIIKIKTSAMPICVVTQMGIADWCNQIQTTPRTKVCYHIHLLVEIYRITLKRMTL